MFVIGSVMRVSEAETPWGRGVADQVATGIAAQFHISVKDLFLLIGFNLEGNAILQEGREQLERIRVACQPLFLEWSRAVAKSRESYAQVLSDGERENIGMPAWVEEWVHRATRVGSARERYHLAWKSMDDALVEALVQIAR